MKNDRNAILNKKLFIFICIVIITNLHFFTTTKIHMLHDVYQRLYYLPIIFAAIWFGVKGGLTTSAIISVIYFTHIVFSWKMNPDVSLQKFLETILFNIVALTTGLLAEREQKLKNKYHETADKLKELYDRLKKQTKDIIELEEQLRRADKLTMLGQISAELAHEIRNPLGSIKGTAEILQQDFPKDDEKYEFVEILMKETNRLNDVLNNFLNFTKEKTASAAVVDVNLLITDVTSFLQIQLKKKNVVIKTDLDKNLSQPKLEGEQLKQVFFNIIINAVQAMPGGGALTITTHKETTVIKGESVDHVFIDFTDTGTGIDDDMINDLFKPFCTSKEQGTGLGLSISNKIIEKFGGEILVKSVLGEGSTFTVKLPCGSLKLHQR